MRRITLSLIGLLVIAGLVAAAPAQASSGAARTPATGTFQLNASADTVAAIQKAGLSAYGISDVRVGLGDSGALGMQWPIATTDGASAYTAGESGGVAWFNGTKGNRADWNAPLYNAGKKIVKVTVYTGSGEGSTITLFDVKKNGKLVLHAGADATLNKALGTNVFTPGMNFGTLNVSVD